MLQIPPDDAAHRDVFRPPGHARPQAADAAHEQFHLRARLARAHEPRHNVRVVHGVDLDADVSRRAEARLRLDVRHQLRLVALRREPERLRLADGLAAREPVERFRRVAPDGRVARQQHEVGVLFGSLFVVVAGADLRVVADAAGTPPRDEAQLRVHLVFRQAVEDAAPRVLEHARVVDVALLVKAGAQLEQALHLLAVLGRVGQRRRDAAAAGEPVERDLDRHDVRVVRRLVQQVDERVDALVRQREQQVVLREIGKVVALLQRHVFGRRDLGTRQPREVKLPRHREHERQIRRRARHEQLPLRQPEQLARERAHLVRDAALHLRAHRLEPAAPPQQPLHHGAQIRVAPVHDVTHGNVGAARHAHDSRLAHAPLAEEQGRKVRYQRRRERELLHAVDRELKKLRQLRRRHEPRAAALARKAHEHILLAVAQKRQRVLGVEHLRAQQRAQRVEPPPQQHLVRLVEPVKVQDLHVLLCQRRRHFAPERFKIFLLPRRLVIDRAQLLARRQARDGLRVPRLQQRPVEQPADAHHIKFIEIRAVDGQKLQPLIARQRLVGCLGQHAAVELQPAQLAVQKQAGIGRVGRAVGKQAAAVALRGHLPQRLRARQLGAGMVGHTIASLGFARY